MTRQEAKTKAHEEALKRFNADGVDGSNIIRAARFGFEAGYEFANTWNVGVPPIDPNDTRAYKQTACIVTRIRQHKNGIYPTVEVLMYNHQHECWDDETGDDFVCSPADVAAWRLLPASYQPKEQS